MYHRTHLTSDQTRFSPGFCSTKYTERHYPRHRRSKPLLSAMPETRLARVLMSRINKLPSTETKPGSSSEDLAVYVAISQDRSQIPVSQFHGSTKGVEVGCAEGNIPQALPQDSPGRGQGPLRRQSRPESGGLVLCGGSQGKRICELELRVLLWQGPKESPGELGEHEDGGPIRIIWELQKGNRCPLPNAFDLAAFRAQISALRKTNPALSSHLRSPQNPHCSQDFTCKSPQV